MQKLTTTPGDLERYHRDGYFVARALFNREEVGLLAERFEAIDRRRAHICHHAARHATHMASFFASAMAFDGQPVNFAENGDAGPCGGPEGTPATGLQ